MKSITMRIRATPEEKESLEKAADATGHTLSSFIRFASLSLAKKVKIEPEKDVVSADKN